MASRQDSVGWAGQITLVSNYFEPFLAIIGHFQTFKAMSRHFQIFLAHSSNLFLEFLAVGLRFLNCVLAWLLPLGANGLLQPRSVSDLDINAIEQVRKNYVIYRRQREEYHIRRFNTINQGIKRSYKKHEGGEVLVCVS